MKTIKFIFCSCLFVIIMGACGSSSINTNQSTSQKQIVQEVSQAIHSTHYKIEVDRALPLGGNSRTLTSNYSVEIKNDSIFSYLPYFGRAYSVPYGGGEGLIFNAPLTFYEAEYGKKDRIEITIKTQTREDTFTYFINVFPNKSASINVVSTNRQSISYQGSLVLP